MLPGKKNRGTILLADADRPARVAIRGLLEAQGYAVLEASGYWESLRVFQLHGGRVDLLLTAIALPENNGYELARALSAIDPNMRCLFMSGRTGAQVSQFYNFPLTGPHLLEKPIRKSELVRRVKGALRAPSGGAQAHHAG